MKLILSASLLKRTFDHFLLSFVALITFVCGFRLHAEDNPADWITQTKTYNFRFHANPGDYAAEFINSDDLGFAPTPGNYEATINYAHLDDDGNIGGVQAPDSMGSCGWPHDPIVNKNIDPDLITVIGTHLSINAFARDNGCDDLVGWTDVSITWKVRPNNGSDSGSCSEAGTPQSENECLKFSIGLGKDSYRQPVGRLLIYTNYPSTILSTPAGLQAFLAPTTERNMANGVLRQIRTSQMLADIVVSNDFCYFINFYSPTNFTSSTVGGLYVPTGPPYTTYIIQNPDASTNVYNRIKINQSGILGSHEYDYTWDTASQQWSLATGGGLSVETRTKTWDSTSTFLTETNTILNSDDSVAFKQIEVYELFPWGETNLIQRVVNPDGAWPQTNTWTYYTNSADGNNYSHLAQITQPSGYWERYSYDSFDRMIEKAVQFGDVGTNATDAQCRVFTYSYGFGNTNDGVIQTNIEKLLGQEIARSYRVDFYGGNSNIVCQTPGASMTAPDNLITVSLQYTTGSFQGWNYVTQNPDGTVTYYQYSTNSVGLTTYTFTGTPDGTGINVIDGTETISLVDLGGNSISNATYDIASGLLLSSAVTLQTDALGRPTLIQYNDGTTQSTQYGCCGIDSQTDRDGVTTSYTYDALKRNTSITRLGITTLYTYDAAGRVLSTTRQGTDNSQILQNVSVYDPSGWLVASTNAMGFSTLYGNYFDSNRNTVKAVTNADSSVSIETDLEDGSPLMITGTATFGVTNAYGVEIPTGESVYRAFTQQIKLNTNGTPTGEWTKTYTDMVGRNYKTVYADGSVSQSFYNNQGQLAEQIDPDGVATLNQYNAKGQLAYSALDVNSNGIIDFASPDQIAEKVSDVVMDNGVAVNRTRTFVWNANNSVISNLVSMSEISTDGLQMWSVIFNNGVGVTNHSVTSYNPIYGFRTLTTTAPDGSSTISVYQDGRLAATTAKDANGVQIAQTFYGYDVHGRQNATTDARNGTTVSYFNNADQPVAALTPSPDGIQNGELATNILDNMGRVIYSIQPDNARVTNVYYPNGLLAETYGTGTYPVQYTYDYAGRMKTMTTWTNFATSSGAAVTTWNYDNYRGFLTNKTYADGKGPSYTYTAAGRIRTRVWARGIGTTNFYNAAGELLIKKYSDSTPAVTNSYDRLGRLSTILSGGMTNAVAYNDANMLLSETYSGGPLNGLSVTNGFDLLLRRTNLTIRGAIVLSRTTYTYDAASRLLTVSDGTNSAIYNYLANSPIVGQITFMSNSVTRMTTSQQYDYLNRLTEISSAPVSAGASQFSFNYTYNNANQRTAITNTDNSYWLYQYDSHGQVFSGKKYWADGTPVAGQQFTYNYDDIGNRQGTASGGDATGSNLRSANYTNNALNEITSRTVPGYVTVLGSANSNSTVTVNLQRAYRYGNYFQAELALINAGTNVFQPITNLAVFNNGTNKDVISTNNGSFLLATTPQMFQYDADGNLTNDGQFIYTWDAENRLITNQSLASVPTNARVQEAWNYLPDGRWSQVIVSKWTGSSFVAQTTNRFVWDGQVLAAEVGPGNALIRSYMRGIDLQGAGGVGGVLEVKYAGTAVTNCFVAYDGNGNVASLINAADGTVIADYEYDPFGQTLRKTGPMASANPMRFSTQWTDDNLGDIKYLYRTYIPNLGKWASRDPIQELGGLNVCNYEDNNPVNSLEMLGLVPMNLDQYEQTMIGNFPINGTLDQFINQADSQINLILNNGGIYGLYYAIATASKFDPKGKVQWNLLRNFMFESGRTDPYIMSKAEVLESKPFFSLLKSKDFLKNLDTAINDKTDLAKKSYSVLGGTLLTATLGQCFFDVEAQVDCVDADNWTATGTFKVHDTYDFDYLRPEAQRALGDYMKGARNSGSYQGRSVDAELKVVVMAEVQKLTQSKPFQVSSEDIPFSQIKSQAGETPPKIVIQ